MQRGCKDGQNRGDPRASGGGWLMRPVLAMGSVIGAAGQGIGSMSANSQARCACHKRGHTEAMYWTAQARLVK
jgi:hypothetical protein